MLYVDHSKRWKSWPIKRKSSVHFLKTSAFSSIYYGGHLTTPSPFITPAKFCYLIARFASCTECSDFFRLSSSQYRKNHRTQIMRSSPKSSYLFLAVSPVDQFITRIFIKGIIKPKEQEKKNKTEELIINCSRPKRSVNKKITWDWKLCAVEPFSPYSVPTCSRR